MEAPKKIWVANDVYRDETPYIRADLVDGLVIALKHWFSSLSDWDQLEDEVKAALKALESAEIGRGME